MDKIVVLDRPTIKLVDISPNEKQLILISDERQIKLIPFDAQRPYSFTELVDAPATYAGQAGKLVGVATNEHNLTFVDPPTSNSDDAVAFAIIFGS
jgi:hypothetical protein